MSQDAWHPQGSKDASLTLTNQTLAEFHTSLCSYQAEHTNTKANTKFSHFYGPMIGKYPRNSDYKPNAVIAIQGRTDRQKKGRSQYFMK
jgi:hypothetical protein